MVEAHGDQLVSGLTSASSITCISNGDLVPGPAIITPDVLMQYVTDPDPNTLLGKRYLSRGGSLLINGQTGLGKSSFLVQAATTWGLGLPLFGIQPVRALRSLIVQAENDIGDLAEMFRGVVDGTGCASRIAELQDHIRFITDAAHCGDSFMPFIDPLINEHKPDLVWIDPLQAFLGGDIKDQKIVSPFIRNGLGSIALRTGVVFIIMHHTNKPQRDNGKPMASNDYSYLGSGSAELANWARAIMYLHQVGDNLYELRAAKRGRRAGMVDSAGLPATEIFLRHGDRGICWERAEAPENEKQAAEVEEADDIIRLMEVGEYTRLEVRDHVMQELGVKRSALMTKGRKANRVYLQVLSRTEMSGKPDCHAVTERHKGCHVTGCHTVTTPYKGGDSDVTPGDGGLVTNEDEAA